MFQAYNVKQSQHFNLTIYKWKKILLILEAFVQFLISTIKCLYFSRKLLILQQHLTAQLPPTFYSGPFAKQSANAVCTELVQLPQQLQLLLLQQPPQLQLANKCAEPSTKSKIKIRPFHIICLFSKIRNFSCKVLLQLNFFICHDLVQTAANFLS